MIPVPPGAPTGHTSSRKESRVNQFVAILRRISAAIALLAAVASLSGLTPALARAQSDAKSDSTAMSATGDKPADAGKTKKTKQAKAPKAPKAPKTPKTPKAAKTVKASTSARTAGSDSSAVAAKPKAEKAPKAAKTKEPEKSWEEQKKEDGIYAKGSNWLSLRFGYAKRTGELAGDGMVGYGVGYQHMISRKYAFAAGVGHDIVGHFAGQLDEAVPFTAEFQRYSRWKTSVRPYVGLGGGFYLRKNYRTGTDYTTTTTGGPHVSVGFTSELDANHAIGFEVRVARIKGREGIVNPTFGPGVANETIWTAKVSWALVY
jgi:hypothetical protein